MKKINFEELYMEKANISFVDKEGVLWIGQVDDYTPGHDNEDGEETFGIKVIYTSQKEPLFYPSYGFASSEVSNVQQVYSVLKDKAVA